MSHHGHPMPQPPTGATMSQLSAWYGQGEPLPAAMEAHIDAWLRLERLRHEWEHAGRERRRELREEADMLRATMEETTNQQRRAA